MKQSFIEEIRGIIKDEIKPLPLKAGDRIIDYDNNKHIAEAHVEVILGNKKLDCMTDCSLFKTNKCISVICDQEVQLRFRLCNEEDYGRDNV